MRSAGILKPGLPLVAGGGTAGTGGRGPQVITKPLAPQDDLGRAL